MPEGVSSIYIFFVKNSRFRTTARKLITQRKQTHFRGIRNRWDWWLWTAERVL